MYIANIVTKSKIQVSSFFNVTEDFESIDKTIPTIIIGWNDVKAIFPEQNILDFKISDNICWTFSKREKRYQYEKDIDAFVKKVIDGLESKINYKFFNYILSSESKRNSFITYVNKGNCSLYYNSRFLYVYNHNDSITLGVSLKDLQYIGIDTKKFILELNKNNNNIICDNLKCIDNDSFVLLKDNIKVIAFLNYLKNIDIYK